MCQISTAALASSKPHHGGLTFLIIMIVLGVVVLTFWKRHQLRSCLSRVRPFGRSDNRRLGRVYSRMDEDEEEEDLLFGMDTVDDSVFPLVPDGNMPVTNTLASIPEQFGDPLGVLREPPTQYRDDPAESDEDLLV